MLLLGLVLCFLSRKFNVYHEKVGIIAFFGCKNSKAGSLHAFYSYNWKGMIKSSEVLKCCGCWFSDGLFDKTVLHKKMVPYGTLLKNCKCRKPFLLFLSVFWHIEMFDLTNFRLVLVICHVHVVIFIQKYLVYLFRISLFVNF